jgi:hypothetical protein
MTLTRSDRDIANRLQWYTDQLGATTCWSCGQPGTLVADPCCAAPDCEHQNDCIHIECMDPEQRRQFDRETGDEQ